MVRYSTLLNAKFRELAAAVMKQGGDASSFKVLVYNGDAEKVVPITGFLIDPDKRTIELQSDVD